jgi:N-acetylmuramoyl-L-alanine amidase
MGLGRKRGALRVAVAAIAGAALLAGWRVRPVAAGQASGAAAQAAGGMNRNVVVLDAAHGGPDAGAQLGNGLLEKDVTLALAARLRASLTSAGFTVVSTRQADVAEALPTDARAETANRARPVACLVIHATGAGTGVHLYASSLAPVDPPEEVSDAEGMYRPPFVPTLWDQAQATSVTQSLHLERELGDALTAGRVPVAAGRASVRPLDNLTCPAVAVEVAPLGSTGGDATPVTDAEYQQRVADALARALQGWRGHADDSPPRAATLADWMKFMPGAQAREAAKARAAAAARITAAVRVAAKAQRPDGGAQGSGSAGGADKGGEQ